MADLNHNILDGLSEKQKEAVTHPLKPLLIIAGPGSGKTRVMSHRIPWIINNYDVNPYEILAVTFTNKAAKELMNRTKSFCQIHLMLWLKHFMVLHLIFLELKVIMQD